MINYVRMYDRNNVLLSSWESVSTEPVGLTYTIYPVPDNANKVVYSITINGITQVYTQYATGCNIEQYYYFNNNYVDTLYCTGKRENTIDITKEKITNGKKLNIVEITIQERVIQNTGLALTEQQLFDLATSPFIFQISGTSVINYILENTTTEGYTTRNFGSRNTVLNLKRDKVQKRYTDTENNFYN